MHVSMFFQHLSLSEEARQKLEVIAGKSMEMMASIKREISSIRMGWSDPSGHVEELEQIFSAFMVSLDAFNLKVQQEQSKSASSDTNSRSHTEVRYRQSICIRAKTSSTIQQNPSNQDTLK